ncbi:MAG: enoyl-CoA hydratase/isomerase family protein [Ignavibacteriales bacterium]|nr:enoyl-CoA hydratase/isomerase family protein [Ignavibacteriales bacterium]
MSGYSTILYSITNNIGIIVLNRPDVYNAFTEQMKRDLNDALKEAEKDPDVRCLVIRGAGDKAFCSGQDLKEHAGKETHRSLKESLEKSYNPMIRRMRSMEKPIVGMINGIAAGAGMSVALACDMRIMADTAKLIEVFIRIALVPDTGSHWFLPRLVGMAKAFEYAALGNDITASEAERVGLVNKVVPAAELEKVTMEIAGKLAQAPTKSVGLIKRALNKALSTDLDSLLDYEAYIQEIASLSEDHKEGVQAFLEKRQPEFKGR